MHHRRHGVHSENHTPHPAPHYDAKAAARLVGDPTQHPLALLGQHLAPKEHFLVFDFPTRDLGDPDRELLHDYIRHYLYGRGFDPKSPEVHSIMTHQKPYSGAGSPFTFSVTDSHRHTHHIIYLGDRHIQSQYIEKLLPFTPQDTEIALAQAPVTFTRASLIQHLAYHELGDCLYSGIGSDHNPMMLGHQRETYSDVFATLMLCREKGKEGNEVASWLANARLESFFYESARSVVYPENNQIYNKAASYLTYRGIRNALAYADRHDLRKATPEQIAEEAYVIANQSALDSNTLSTVASQFALARMQQVLFHHHSIHESELTANPLPSKWEELSYHTGLLALDREHYKLGDMQECIDLGLVKADNPVMRAIMNAHEDLTGEKIKGSQRSLEL